MKKPIVWQASHNGIGYTFSYTYAKKTDTLTVNGGEPIQIPHRAAHGFVGYDEPFSLDGREARFVMDSGGKKPDIAVDGLLLSNGKTYRKTPA